MNDLLQEKLTFCNLVSVSKCYDQLVATATKHKWSYEQFSVHY